MNADERGTWDSSAFIRVPFLIILTRAMACNSQELVFLPLSQACLGRLVVERSLCAF